MNKVLSLGVATLAVAGVVGAVGTTAYAINGQADGIGYAMQHGNGQGGGYQPSLESRAKVLGMSAAELQKALETKTMSQLALERGMTEDSFRAKMLESAKVRWESRGLSAEQIAERMAEREQRHAANQANHEFGSGEGRKNSTRH